MQLRVLMPSNMYYPHAWVQRLIDAFDFLWDTHPSTKYAVMGLAGYYDLAVERLPDDLDRAVDFVIVARFLTAMREMYGPRANRHLLRRATQRWFTTFTEPLAQRLAHAERSSAQDRVAMVLAALATIFSDQSDQLTAFEHRGDEYLWIIHRCSCCMHQQAQEAICDLMLGLLEAACAWADPRLPIQAQEVLCCAKGDAVCMLRLTPTRESEV